MADSDFQGSAAVLHARHNLLSESLLTYNTVHDAKFPARRKYPSPFMRKFLTLACILIVIPLIPSKPPQFIDNTFFSKIWDFLRFSIIGVVISYGLCHHSDDHVDFETQSGVGASVFTGSRASSGFHYYNNVHSSSERNQFQSYRNEDATYRDDLDLVAKNFTLEFSDLDTSSSFDSAESISRSEFSHMPVREGDGKLKKLTPSGNDIPFVHSGDVKLKKSSHPSQTSPASNDEDEEPIKPASPPRISSAVTMHDNQKAHKSDVKNMAGGFLRRDRHNYRQNVGIGEEDGITLSNSEPKASPWSYFESDLMQPHILPLSSSREEMESVIHGKGRGTATAVSSFRTLNNLDLGSAKKILSNTKPETDTNKQFQILGLLKESDRLSAQIEELNGMKSNSYSRESSEDFVLDGSIEKSNTWTSIFNSEEPDSKTMQKTKESSSFDLTLPSDYMEDHEIHGSGFISTGTLPPGSTTMNTKLIITSKSNFNGNSENIVADDMNPTLANEKHYSFEDDQRGLEAKESDEMQAKEFPKASLKGKSVRTFRYRSEGGRKSAGGVQREDYQNTPGKPEYELSGTSKMKYSDSQYGGRRHCPENSKSTEIKAENMRTNECVVTEAGLGESNLGVSTSNRIENLVLDAKTTTGIHRIEGKSIKVENNKAQKEARSKPEKRLGIHKLWNGFRKQSADISIVGMVKIKDMIRDQTEKDMNGNSCSNCEGEMPLNYGKMSFGAHDPSIYDRRQDKEKVVLIPKSASRLHVIEPKEEIFKNKFTSYRDEDDDSNETDGSDRTCATNEIDKRASDFISRFRKQMQVEKVPVIVNEIDLKAGEFISKFKERIMHEKTSVRFW